MRRLIINADDLGLTKGVNRAIFDAHLGGIVTSATLMANGSAVDDALTHLHTDVRTRDLSVGCHLTLVDGQPLSPPQTIPTLLDGASDFRQSVGELGFAARGGQLKPAEVEREALAQFSKLTSSGIKLSHFDAHKHAHMFPQILEPALRAARECGIRAVRNPFESPRSLPFRSIIRNPKLLKRMLQVSVLRSMRSRWSDIVARSGLATTDGSLGVIVTGELDETLLRMVLERMPEGTWEFVCHPGYDDQDLARIRTRLRASRSHELSLLASPETRRLIERLGIQLISFHEL